MDMSLNFNGTLSDTNNNSKNIVNLSLNTMSIQDQENLAEPKKNESLMNTISIQEELLIKNDPEKTSQASLHSKASGKITGIFN